MRLTLDLDNMSEKRVRAKAVMCKLMFPDSEVKYRMSSSGKGGHVVVHDCGMEWEEICWTRLWLGDHARRISMDCQRKGRNYPIQVLFSAKSGKKQKAGEWKSIYTQKTCIKESGKN